MKMPHTMYQTMTAAAFCAAAFVFASDIRLLGAILILGIIVLLSLARVRRKESF